MNQAVEVMHGPLEIGQYRTHFIRTVAQVFGHHLIGIADPVHQPMVISLNLRQHIQHFRMRTSACDQHG